MRSKIYLLSIFLLICLPITYSQVVYETSSNKYEVVTTNSTSIQNFQVPAGNNRILTVSVTYIDFSFPSITVEFGDQNLLQAEFFSRQGSQYVSIWYLKLGSGDALSDDIKLNWSTSERRVVRISSSVYSNVDQNNPIGSTGKTSSGQQTAPSSSITIPTVQNSVVIDALWTVIVSSPVAGLNQVQIYNHCSSPNCSGFSRLLATTTMSTLDWSFSSNSGMVHVVVELLENTSPLPVDFMTFEGKLINNVIDLEWRTGFEFNSYGYEVQKSETKTNWKRIGIIESYGDTKVLSSYNFTDHNPSPGINYYRLKQIDFDGNYEYSDVISVYFDTSEELSVYPNPVRTLLNVSGIQAENTYPIYIYDITGRLVVSSFNQSSIDVSELDPGLYFLKLGDQARSFIKN